MLASYILNLHSFSLETLVVLHGKGRVGPVSSVAFFYECDDVV